MATYLELFNFGSTESDLRNKITTACIIAAESIMDEIDTTPNHANRMLWAASVFENPRAESERMLWALLAANNAASIATIEGAPDATIQSEVDAHVDLFAIG